MADLTQLTRAPFEELRAAGENLDPAQFDSCAIFGKCVIRVEAVLKLAYKMAALTARRSDTLQEEAEVWKEMSELCDSLIAALKGLKDKFPDCGTPELYDVALDYKLASEKRYSLTVESIKCQTIQMPEGLFPQGT
jgi:hypothetical protein